MTKEELKFVSRKKLEFDNVQKKYKRLLIQRFLKIIFAILNIKLVEGGTKGLNSIKVLQIMRY